jgi:hypothetical protein
MQTDVTAQHSYSSEQDNGALNFGVLRLYGAWMSLDNGHTVSK